MKAKIHPVAHRPTENLIPFTSKPYLMPLTALVSWPSCWSFSKVDTHPAKCPSSSALYVWTHLSSSSPAHFCSKVTSSEPSPDLLWNYVPISWYFLTPMSHALAVFFSIALTYQPMYFTYLPFSLPLITLEYRHQNDNISVCWVHSFSPST